jgi:hypothetical protein
MKSWMQINFIGESQPNKREIHLDFGYKKNWYEEYQEIMQIRGKEYLNYTSFCVTWKRDFKHVKISPKNSIKSKCSCCRIIKELIISSKLQIREKYYNILQTHRIFTRNEKQLYYDRREFAETNKHKCISLIIDGMDQSKGNISHSVNYQNQYVINTKLTLIIVHGI